VRVPALTSSDGNELGATVVHSREDERLAEAIDSVDHRTRIRPVPESNVVASDGSSIAKYAEQKRYQDKHNLYESQPKLDFAKYNDSQKPNTLIESPGHQDPAIVRYLVCPVAKHDCYEIVLGRQVDRPLLM
jgi:hypothetical protein